MNRLILFPVIAIALAGCTSEAPPELRDARSEVQHAMQGSAASLAPADLHVAQEQLQLAERSFANDGDSFTTRDLAYSAQRKAQLAEVHGETLAARQQQSDARTQVDNLKDERLRTTSAELSSTRQALNGAQQNLTVQGQQLAQAEKDKADAERRAQQATTDLARIASVKQEPRGMVITLSGAVLFASAKHDLLGPAQAKLSEVANVLTRQDPDSKIRVIGYTDSQGSEAFNMQLSRDRADSVRTYLVMHGIAADRISSEGVGPASPVADNTSAEGRADNRRVEIVVQPKESHSSKSVSP